MQLPPSLRRAIEQLAQGHSISSLAQAASDISTAYRGTSIGSTNSGNSRAGITGTTATPQGTKAIASPAPAIARALSSDIDRLAYLVTRMPATYAATHAVFSAVKERMPDLAVETVLDLGAGPGTAAWAASDVFTEARNFLLVEKNAPFAALGKTLAAESDSAALRSAKWETADIARSKTFAASDLVVMSYSIGEVQSAETVNLISAAWDATRKVLCVIEPGTPAGFARIRSLRAELLQRGGHMVAPCPHAAECPMTGDDWCHFAARVERSSIHRRVKGGTLGFEDEKYSYVAVAKTPVEPAQARIIRHPQHRPGFIELRLCTTDGLRDATVSRRNKSEFRQAKKSIWGSAWKPEK